MRTNDELRSAPSQMEHDVWWPHGLQHDGYGVVPEQGAATREPATRMETLAGSAATWAEFAQQSRSTDDPAPRFLTASECAYLGVGDGAQQADRGTGTDALHAEGDEPVLRSPVMLDGQRHATSHPRAEQGLPMCLRSTPWTSIIPPSPSPTASERTYDEPLYDKSPGVAAHVETRRNPRVEFDRLASGNLHFDKVPQEIVLPRAAQHGMQQEWDASKHGTAEVQEHGGNLVRNHRGKSNYVWRTGTPGNDQMFAPDYDDVGKDQKLIAVGHTHPYSNGKKNVSFSGEDISSIVDERQPINLLQSGETQYVIARTAQFEAMLKKLDDDDKEKLKRSIEGTWYVVFGRDGAALPDGPYQERVERAVRVTCATFDLAYYRGQGGTLKHVV